jgi:hypothetical protein
LEDGLNNCVSGAAIAYRNRSLVDVISFSNNAALA